MLLTSVKRFLLHSCSCHYSSVTPNKIYILSSYEPISLLKVDYKSLAKMLSLQQATSHITSVSV